MLFVVCQKPQQLKKDRSWEATSYKRSFVFRRLNPDESIFCFATLSNSSKTSLSKFAMNESTFTEQITNSRKCTKMSSKNFFNRKIIFSIASAGLIFCATTATAQECPYSKSHSDELATQADESDTQLVAYQSGEKSAAKSDIVDTAVGAGDFTTLVAAVKKAGLVETLKGDGPFTVLAPSDEAFGKIPASSIDELMMPENKEKLTAILTNHVIKGEAMAADVQGMKSVKTIGGSELPVVVKDGAVMIGDAKVVKADIGCSNGVIHVIDTVLMPGEKAAGSDKKAAGSDKKMSDKKMSDKKDIVDTAVGAEDFSTLVAAVKAADLVETLKGEGPFTVFAPNDAAFEKVEEATLTELLKPENKETLQGILTYHVVPGKVMAADVVELESAETASGKKLKIMAKDGKVMINGAKVIATDIECENGVIHVIDTVLMPSDQ